MPLFRRSLFAGNNCCCRPIPLSPTCGPLPGINLFSFFIAPGSLINVLGLLELSSSSGVCVNLRIPPPRRLF